MNATNPRGAGRKPSPYQTQLLRVSLKPGELDVIVEYTTPRQRVEILLAVIGWGDVRDQTDWPHIAKRLRALMPSEGEDYELFDFLHSIAAAIDPKKPRA